ncbi:protein of unknown function DUF1836 [Clostridium carboxidivorans P7]|uniref:DUF1836 domain-containing protein n=1 Tax=Clostridium carboxidivorans P7 TaxID=536227 RepID=C6PVY7_9CLOT|nr:DUF1836 domain-containing protein [Clostridium carboxidivorans]EET86618.1 protein of unknown function DUF1836 [Clostridium carboxidivorans P7]EFG89995.1 hypothetical protein CLCAR_0189 [Clostridium carboxidivorans P7]
MNIDNESLKKLLEEVCSFEQLEFSGIPDIDLYMDQVTTFIDDKFSHLKRNEKDTAITKTMINNYTKAGILMPPKKKKYSRQHMVLIILTYYLKQILSINDIQELFAPIVEDINKSEDSKVDLNDIYNNFLDIEKKETEDFKLAFEKSLDCQHNDKNKEDTSKLIIIVIKLILKSSIEKRMAEKIIDEFFKDEKLKG